MRVLSVLFASAFVLGVVCLGQTARGELPESSAEDTE